MLLGMLEELGGLERKAANEEFEKRVENVGATLDVTLDRKKAGEHASSDEGKGQEGIHSSQKRVPHKGRAPGSCCSGRASRTRRLGD